MKWKRGWSVALVATLALCVPAVAQPESGEPAATASAPTATGESGLFTLFTAETLPRGEWSFGAYYNNWDRVFEFDGESDLDWHQASVSLGYGLTDRFELFVSVPYLNLDPDFEGPAADDDSESGLGNAVVGGKWRLTGTRGGGGVALKAFVEAPTGDEEVLAGDTGFGAGIGWTGGNWVLNADYRVAGDLELDTGDVELSDEVRVGIGHVASISDRLDWISEVAGIFPTDSDEAIFER